MLLNQAWVYSVSQSKADLLGCGNKKKKKMQHLLQSTKQGAWIASAQKPWTPWSLPGEGF